MNTSQFAILQHILLLCCAIYFHITTLHAADSSVTWHYEEREDGYGPSEWFKIPGAELCGNSQQSPIEINPDDFENFDTSCTAPLQWNIDDTTYDFTVSHKGEGGHTLLFKSTEASSNIYLNNRFQFDGNSQHSRYILDSFHAHWGPGNQNGSEHVYTGITTTLEIHFVHYSADYADVGEAVAAWEDASSSDDPLTNDMHTLAVVGILFEEVSEDLNETYNEMADAIILEMAQDPGMDALWRDGSTGGETTLSLKITDLMDVDDFVMNYYYYEGSLTTPPCTPAVRWHLARNTIKIRDSTMDLFRAETKLWQSPEDLDIDADRNFRPTQTNPSCVWICADNDDLKWCPDIIKEVDYPDWHYEDDLPDGPSNWKNLEGGELCGHEQQSPILINPSDFDLDRSCQEPLEWNVDDTIYDWTITHSGEGGHTLYVANENAKNNVYLTNLFQYENNYQHPRYNFYSFHVHWGPGNRNGSEHVFKGRTTTFEVHFVHHSNDYVTVGEAVNAWYNLSESTDETANDMHTLAVAGFLFTEVCEDEEYNRKADNIILQMALDDTMDELWQNATSEAHLSFAITDLVDVEDFKKNYYFYEGSLTTPPCTPAVRWHLAQNPIRIRASTMSIFRAETLKWSTATGAVDADRNFRPIQSNPSCVWTCGDRWCPDEEDMEIEIKIGVKLLPLWIVLGVVLVLVLICIAVYIFYFKPRAQLTKDQAATQIETGDKMEAVEMNSVDMDNAEATTQIETGDKTETAGLNNVDINNAEINNAETTTDQATSGAKIESGDKMETVEMNNAGTNNADINNSGVNAGINNGDMNNSDMNNAEMNNVEINGNNEKITTSTED